MFPIGYTPHGLRMGRGHGSAARLRGVKETESNDLGLTSDAWVQSLRRSFRSGTRAGERRAAGRRAVRLRPAACAGVAALVLLAACSGGSRTPRATPATHSSSSSRSTTPTSAAILPSRYDHVVWVWMENHRYSEVIGSPAAPYETELAHRYGTATDYHSVGSPSLPNYIGATSGSTHGIDDDAGPSSHSLADDNVFRQVRTAGGTARSFEEHMSSPCETASRGRYAVKHNPAAYYTGGDDRDACQRDDIAFSSTLPAGPLPTFAFVTPDLCDDTHDCSVSTGDAWLKTFLAPLLVGDDYAAGRTVIFIVWDEYTRMPNIVISPTTPRGTVSRTRFNHYSLLRTTEELLGVPLLGKAATATSMRAAFDL
jgi:phosphatidylinositol-3-phosphatase